MLKGKPRSVKPLASLGGQETGPERLTLSVEEAGQVLGLSRNSAYEAARRGEIPTLRFGRRLVVPKAKLMALLGENSDGGSRAAPEDAYRVKT